jgi:hypothetical protein
MSSHVSQQNNQPLAPLASNTFTTRGFHELAFYSLSSEVIKIFLA